MQSAFLSIDACRGKRNRSIPACQWALPRCGRHGLRFSRYLNFSIQRNRRWPDSRPLCAVCRATGSMLIYRCSICSDMTNIRLDDIKNFRNWASPNCRHPEYAMRRHSRPLPVPLRVRVYPAMPSHWPWQAQARHRGSASDLLSTIPMCCWRTAA